MLPDNEKIITQLAEQYNIPVEDVKKTYDTLIKLDPVERELISDIILILASEEKS